MGLKPSLLNQIDMECKSPLQCSESERMDLEMGINNLKNLMGVIPPPLSPLTSTTSFSNYPRETTWMGLQTGALLEESQEMTMNQIVNQEDKDDLTRRYESTNLKCHGSKPSSKLEGQTLTRAVTKHGTFSKSSKDPVAVKHWIRSASSAPAGFPSTEWDALIKGESINIDTVFSSLHHVHCVDESIGHVGSTEIQFGRPKPATKVEMSGQWTATFNLIIKATAFIFPHRYDELRIYEDYIEELFSTKSTTVHPKLFKYDEAVRYKVGQGQNILLTDRNEFTWYYEAIVAPDSVRTQTAGDGNKGGLKKGGKSGEKSDFCHRFNGANGCSSTTDKCKYKHVCKKCKQSGHGKVDCKVNEGV